MKVEYGDKYILKKIDVSGTYGYGYIKQSNPREYLIVRLEDNTGTTEDYAVLYYKGIDNFDADWANRSNLAYNTPAQDVDAIFISPLIPDWEP